ncbi:nucleotide-binding oligomerization domain-containing protein 2-like isoform X2 [Sycon ciliatum]|uniref:nucleotide-binding oligomerization domain-containing protein 2-like isoform X2 n=1 Tax=Sycon ciliatum TaxID=27933 RepID=UPI0031F68047
MGNKIVPAVTGSLFDSPEFIADIHPWLLTVDADMLREAAQQNQLLRTFAIVASLENILKREGPVAHNKKLIQIISADELNGYKRLCHVVAEMGFHTRARQMLSQLREKDRPCLDLPSSVDMETTGVRRRARTGVGRGNDDSDGRPGLQSTDGNVTHRTAEALEEDCHGEEEGHGAEERNETAVEHEPSSSVEPVTVLAQRPVPFLAMVAGLSVLIIAVISVYYGFSSPVSPDMGRVERLLKIRYTKTNKIFSQVFGASTGNTVENIYINLVMLPKKNLSDEFENGFESSSDDMWRTEHAFTRASQKMQSVYLESLLNSTHHDQSPYPTGQTLGTIVMASAGCGKSFVFTRVAPIKWAAGELWPNKKLLVARELRFPDVHKATSLSKLLGLDGIGIEDSYGQLEICDHVREHPESLVLILDGLDEVNLKDMSSFVYDVLFGKELQGIHLIVTSRPCADIFQLSVLPHFHQHIELMGFKQDDVEKYIRNVLSPEKAGTLVAEVGRSAYLRGMMATPFMAQEVCVQYHFGLDAPQCMTDMFEQMIVQIINRKYGQAYKNWNEVPVEAQLLVMEIGQFAFKMLANKQMIFSDVDLQKHSLSEHAFKLGLLVTGEESLSSNVFKQHRFSHLTTQEYLAAIYLARHPTRDIMNSSRIIQLVERLGAETAHLRTFWTMLCAQLNAEQAECFVNSLLTLQNPQGMRIKGDWVKHDFQQYKSRFNSWDFVQSPNIPGYSEMRLDRRKHLRSLAFQSFAELAMQRRRDSFPLPSMRKLLSFPQTLDIEGDHHPAELRSIDVVLRHHPHDVQIVSINSWTPGTKLHFPSSLANCSGIRVLSLGRASEEGILDIVTSALQHSAGNLHILHLHHLKISASLLETISSCPKLYLLDLEFPSLTKGNAGAFARALSNLTTLQQISLQSSLSLGSDGGAAIFRALHRSSNLSNVGFRNCHMAASMLPVFTTALQNWKHLTNLKLSGNNFSDADAPTASQFFSALSRLPDLQHIDLSDCHLSKVTGFAFASELFNIRTLNNIDLSYNANLGDDAVIDILHALRQCKGMSRVSLNNCSLTAASLPAITAALRSWPELTTLSLRLNDFSAVTAEQANDFVAAVHARRKRVICWLRDAEGMLPSRDEVLSPLISVQRHRYITNVV